MIRAVMTMRQSALAGLALIALLVGLSGCTGPQVRSQSEDDGDREPKYDVKTVGDVTDVGNVEPIVVAGVGLVVNLDGTGGNPAPGPERTMLEDQLQKNRPQLDALLKHSGAKNLKEILASLDTSLVRVSAVLPAGCRKDEPVDVEITLPPNSRTTNLRGGYLLATVLHNFDYARNLSPAHADSNQVFKGHGLAKAEGPLLVGFGDGDEAARVKQARIWGGTRGAIDRPFFLLLKKEQQFARVASVVADRINETFHSTSRIPGSAQVAVAKDKYTVVLNVPSQYRLNLPRFLRVVRLVPMNEAPEKAAKEVAKAPYRKRLEDDLNEPARTVTAALRMEALGRSSVPALKAAMQKKHPLVRFCAAETLAYLGEPAAGEVLALMVEDHAVLRAFSLTAMASLDEAVCHVKLRELLASPNPETRYGAFRALRALNEHDEALGGERLNDSFWLHRVVPNTTPMVHVSSGKRAEVVLFGEEAQLLPPFSFRAGDFTLVAGDNDTRCTVSRFSPHRGRRDTRQCALQLEEVLRTLAGLGGTYPEAVEFLRQAGSCKCLSCRMEVDRLPQAVSVYELARASTFDPELLRRDAEILDAKPDFGSTPTLYERGFGRRPRTAVQADQEAMRADDK